MYDGSCLPDLSLDLGSAPDLDLAPWHQGREHLVANALTEARAAAAHLIDLARQWIPRLPRRPRASQNIRSICRDPASAPLLLACAAERNRKPA